MKQLKSKLVYPAAQGESKEQSIHSSLKRQRAGRYMVISFQSVMTTLPTTGVLSGCYTFKHNENLQHAIHKFILHVGQINKPLSEPFVLYRSHADKYVQMMRAVQSRRENVYSSTDDAGCTYVRDERTHTDDACYTNHVSGDGHIFCLLTEMQFITRADRLPPHTCRRNPLRVN